MDEEARSPVKEKEAAKAARQVLVAFDPHLELRLKAKRLKGKREGGSVQASAFSLPFDF